MSPKLFALLVDNIKKFFDREDVCNELGEFYFGEKTTLLFARGLEAMYNAMAYTAKMEQTSGEEAAQHGVQPTVLCGGHPGGSDVKNWICQTCGLPVPHSR